jgi:hypothetical protein
MRRIIMATIVFGMVCAAGSAMAAEGDQKFAGTFVWSNGRGKANPITAVFTPNGDKKWNAVFTFTWGKNEQVWKGTVEGTLKDGEIKGEVKNGDEKRKFNFTGAAKDGQFECTHNEMTSGRPVATGTMVIKKQ